MFKKSFFKRNMFILIVVLITAFFIGSSLSYAQTTTSNASVTIESFKSSARNVALGSSVILSYKVSNAAIVEIEGTGKNFDEPLATNKGFVEVWPHETTTYTLCAYNSNKVLVAQNSITVYVNTVEINPYVSSSEVEPYEDVTLSWNGSFAKSLTISANGMKDITYNYPISFNSDKGIYENYDFSGSVVVNPAKTTEYTFTATDVSGKTAVKKVTVNVFPTTINEFYADKVNIAPEEDVKLTWETSYAKEVTLNDGTSTTKLLNLSGSIILNPPVSTTYTLSAISYDGKTAVTKTVSVNVQNVKINDFRADKSEIFKGESVKLSWDIANAKYFEIYNMNKLIETSSNNSMELWPEKTTTFVLIATGYDGKEVLKYLTVTVKPAEINSFKASASEILPGDSSTLTWNVTNAKSYSITDNKGNKLYEVDSVKSGLNSLTVQPTEDTTYTLKVFNYDGTSVKSEVTVKVSKLDILFAATKTQISEGELVNLSWATENAVKTYIETNTGARLFDRPLNGSIYVTPFEDTTYTLVAIDANGNVARSSILIKVN